MEIDDAAAAFDNMEVDDDVRHRHQPPNMGGLLAPNGGLAITVDTVRDNIVSNSTSRSYIADILLFCFWCRMFAVDCLTDFAVAMLDDFSFEYPGRDAKFVVSKTKERFKSFLRNACNVPLIDFEYLKPPVYMSFVITLRKRDGNYLSKSSYGQKRSSLGHLFRCHNNVGFEEKYKNELAHLFNGFFRQLAATPGINRTVLNDDGNEEVVILRNWNVEEGKEPMSVELYLALCGWLLSMGTHRGIFAHLYLVLTWNLACRSNNTMNIKLGDIIWSTSFDSFHILFRHSKTDPMGDDSMYPRHIFANPKNPVCCPVLALCFYFTCCFSTTGLNSNCYLFPGESQERRFSDIMMKCLKEHEHEVNHTYGFEVGKLGPHSIRKGASSFLVSLPGGPPAAASSLRGGWSMGGVKDRYWQYMESGDQFVGRCLCLLPIMSVMFACSPPFFDVVSGSEVDKEVNEWVFAQFPYVSGVVGLGRLCRMCIASLLYHKEWIMSFFNVNHIIVSGSVVLRRADVMLTMSDHPTLLAVTFPWNDSVHNFSGIPPHAALLQQIAEIRSSQCTLVETFVDRVREALTTHGYGPNRLTADTLQVILREFQTEFQTQVQRVIRVADGGVTRQQRAVFEERLEEGKTYRMHQYGGIYHRVPQDWRFLRCNTMSLWRSWWMGDDDRQITPLKSLDNLDVRHLDAIPLSEWEMNGRPGPNATVRRKSSKDLCDMRFLMKLMTNIVEEVGALEDDISISSVDRMFSVIADRLVVGARHPQKTWITVVSETRRRKNTVLIA